MGLVWLGKSFRLLLSPPVGICFPGRVVVWTGFGRFGPTFTAHKLSVCVRVFFFVLLPPRWRNCAREVVWTDSAGSQVWFELPIISSGISRRLFQILSRFSFHVSFALCISVALFTLLEAMITFCLFCGKRKVKKRNSNKHFERNVNVFIELQLKMMHVQDQTFKWYFKVSYVNNTNALIPVISKSFIIALRSQRYCVFQWYS